MTDPVVGPAVTIQDLAAQVQQIRTQQAELIEGVDEQISAIDTALTSFKKGSRRAIWGSYIWHVVHIGLTGLLAFAGIGAVSIINRLDNQQAQIIAGQDETARIRKEILCPFYSTALSYQSTPEANRAVPPERRAQYEAGIQLFRNATEKLHCDQ